MLNLKVIGAGAAGNKAAIQLVKDGFSVDDVTLINSTSRDIPEEYKKYSIIFGSTSDTLGGCGKERDVGKKLILRDMKDGVISLDGIANPNTNAVIIVSSTEGGSGSAVTPIVAKYIREVIGIPVIIILFFGFNTDVRGMRNSIEICQELSDNYGVIGISNAKFLAESGNNKMKAEQKANEEFSRIVNIISGTNIYAGSQNIDATDLYKLVTTTGYMCVGTANIGKIKNIDQFNKSINEAIDESKLVDSNEKGSKRIGVIFDMPDSMSDSVDYNASTIIHRYGVPYEMFTHVQNVDESGHVTWIAAGLPMPIKEVQEIYDNYQKASSSMNRKKDTFFDFTADLSGNEEDGEFDVLSRTSDKTTKNDFFSDFGISGKK